MSAEDSVVRCVCGAMSVIVRPGTEISGLRCWNCPPEHPRPSLTIVPNQGFAGLPYKDQAS